MARRRRRRSGTLGYTPRAGSPFLSGPPARRRRRNRSLPSLSAVLTVIVVIAALGAGGYYLVSKQLETDHRPATVRAFVTAWEKGDQKAMWRLIDARSRKAHPELGFTKDYAQAYRAATVKTVAVGRLSPVKDGVATAPVTVTTRYFGTLRGTVRFPVHEEGQTALIAWTPDMRLPGLRGDEEVRRRSGDTPRRGDIYDTTGRLLADDPTGASIAGVAGDKPTGLERIYNDRLAGRPSSTLRFGDRTVAKVPRVPGRSVHTTIRLGLQKTALSALGGKLGGVAVVKPSDGSVLALAGLAVSAPQPPGSTFKIITLAAALQHGVAKPTSSYPRRTSATLSGVKLGNASGETCGGSLTASFADSCNSVFAPLGAKLGAKKLVATAEAFGFNDTPAVPAAKPSTIPKASQLKDAIAVGSSAIGQNKDLATPLGMAEVGATIGNRGVHVKPRIVKSAKVHRNRAVSSTVAGNVRDMMIAVISSGTGTAGAVPGVQVAGKTGTAELVANSKNPKDADAWFVAFAPARKPKVAVAVMLVGAGFGGTAAAPVAKKVLQAAL
ncbi:penicillin-binding transpeptidase domain-containing protein [Candidatus Solirubrobacter pratensis]|uniref:penicillin-binding transpeptidase domain-containing protein n=1 Tax=Candidatus Solirubrobacter pratensis TaxID=1298857 RepID=UPI00041A01BC|nr:penicillin-binding transpeptidase domain-containing protein [Candidatus Solirubrobacter pratensis]